MAVLQSVRERRRGRRGSPAVADRMAYATKRMATLNEMLSAQTSAAARAAAGLANGSVLRRTVMITGMRQIAMVNFDLLFEFDLTVVPDGLPAYPATTQQLVRQQDVRQLVPGLTVEATVDLANSAAIRLDLGSLR
ncbi:MAG TPA: hypothetical protein VIX15_01200 [Streptosporangiaceae bacterium]